jgi:hypothetical protein
MKLSSRVLLAVVLLAGSCGETKRPTNEDVAASVEEMAWVEGYADGQWEPDWDDAAFYGPAFYARVGWQDGREDYQQRAREAVEHNLGVLRDAAGSSDAFLENMTEILYGTLGIMDYMAASGDTAPMADVDTAIDTANTMLHVLSNDYLSGMSNYAMDTYGPTTVTAMMAIVNLQYAVLFDTPREAERIASARTILGRIDEEAWDGTKYLFAPDRPDWLEIYPNIVMMIALVRMYQATGEAPFLERAEALFDAIQPLRCTERPGYKSPYSAEAMGAQTDDYSTLSAMNYTLFAFSLLAQVTGKAVYRDEIVFVLDFVREYLWVPEDGKVYHHWMDGRLALPTDLEYYCIGCNLQLIYVLWWIRSNLDWLPE